MTERVLLVDDEHLITSSFRAFLVDHLFRKPLTVMSQVAGAIRSFQIS